MMFRCMFYLIGLVSIICWLVVLLVMKCLGIFRWVWLVRIVLMFGICWVMSVEVFLG